MNAVQVASQLEQLSADADNQVHIAREEGCLNGLVDFVLSDDLEVTLAALRGLSNLSSHPQNKTLLLEHGCLLTNVKTAAAKWESNSKVSEVVHATLKQLNVSLPPKRKQFQDYLTPASPSADRKTRSVIMKIDGLHRGDVKHSVEMTMVSIKGVVSFTLDRTQVVVLFRGDTTSVDAITKKLAGVDVNATVVSEDVAVSSPCVTDKENAPTSNNNNSTNINNAKSTPSRSARKKRDYSCSETPVHSTAAHESSPRYLTPPDSKKGGQGASAVVTCEDNSLKARLAAQKKRRKQKETRLTSLFSKFSLW